MVATLAFLAYAAGAMDVLSFLKFKQVFASAMTGNTALLGLGLAQGHWIAASHSVATLAAFAFGNFLGTKVFDAGTSASKPERCRRLLVIEVLGLAAVALLWGLAPHPLPDGPLYALIVVAAASMGVQSVVGREIGMSGVLTVVFTSTLTMIMISAARGDFSPDTRRRIAIMLIYFLGAAISGLFADYAPDFMAVPPFAAAAAALAVSVTIRFRIRRDG